MRPVMPSWLGVLVISGITAGACVDVSAGDARVVTDEHGPSGSERSSSTRAHGADAGLSWRVARALPRDAGRIANTSDRRDVTFDAEPDAEVESDLDAGFPELATPILRDCTETLRCNVDLPASLESCIAVSTGALSRASPEARQRFLAIIMRCSALRGCEYVSCTMQP